MVKDGTLNLEELEKANVTKQQVFAMLREKNIQNLAKVERAYLEACGIFSVYETNESKAGLPILPPSNRVILSDKQEVDSNTLACCNCSHVQKVVSKNSPCEICHSIDWSKAYL